MNRFLREEVIAPPIPAFKAATRAITPESGQCYDFSQAIPWYPMFRPIRDALAQELLDPHNDFYSPDLGLASLRAKIREWHPLGSHVSADEVVVTSGANHAIHTLFTTLFHQGERVALLEPFYFNHDMSLRMLGLEPVHHALRPETGFQLVAADLIRGLAGHDVKGIVLVSPNNPTGAVFQVTEMVSLLEWSRQSGVEVILDETYLGFDPTSHQERQKLAPYLGRGLTVVGSFSKSHSLTGYRVGYILASQTQVEEILKVQDSMIIAPCTLSQRAAEIGLTRCGAEVTSRREELATLRAIVEETAPRLQRVVFRSIGVFFGFLEHVGGGEDAALELYRNTGILGLPGSIFGKNHARFIRIAYANLGEKRLRDALSELERYDARLARGAR